jgi:NAD(P)-dependent dehydrogenase (short-subunit alcohol dehydrogenase family)
MPTTLVTGATDGIGRAAAIALARAGHEILLVGRSAERAEAARRAVAAAAPDPARVHVLLADLSRMDEVRRLAAEVRARAGHLDVLANNAGALFTTRRVTPDGFEATMALNHLAPFLLTAELMPLLRAAPEGARVIATASNAHANAAIDLDDLQLERRWSPPGAYGTSKLANVLFTRALARRLEGTRVVAQCFHPGVVRTGFGKKDAWYVALVWRGIGPLLRSSERGARTLVHLATADEALAGPGRYWVDERPATASARARDDALADGLWERSAHLVGASSVPTG